jgi:hypothetical protein
LLAAMDHSSGVILAQVRVDGKSNEISASNVERPRQRAKSLLVKIGTAHLSLPVCSIPRTRPTH